MTIRKSETRARRRQKMPRKVFIEWLPEAASAVATLAIVSGAMDAYVRYAMHATGWDMAGVLLMTFLMFGIVSIPAVVAISVATFKLLLESLNLIEWVFWEKNTNGGQTV